MNWKLGELEILNMFPRANLKEILLWLLRRRRRFRIAGHSMEPILHEGDEMLVKLLWQDKRDGDHANLVDRPSLRYGVTQGDLVVVEHPKRSEFLVVKQWDGKGLQSLCHRECGVDAGRMVGVATSVW